MTARGFLFQFDSGSWVWHPCSDTQCELRLVSKDGVPVLTAYNKNREMVVASRIVSGSQGRRGPRRALQWWDCRDIFCVQFFDDEGSRAFVDLFRKAVGDWVVDAGRAGSPFVRETDFQILSHDQLLFKHENELGKREVLAACAVFHYDDGIQAWTPCAPHALRIAVHRMQKKGAKTLVAWAGTKEVIVAAVPLDVNAVKWQFDAKSLQWEYCGQIFCIKFQSAEDKARVLAVIDARKSGGFDLLLADHSAPAAAEEEEDTHALVRENTILRRRVTQLEQERSNSMLDMSARLQQTELALSRGMASAQGSANQQQQLRLLSRELEITVARNRVLEEENIAVEGRQQALVEEQARTRAENKSLKKKIASLARKLLAVEGEARAAGGKSAVKDVVPQEPETYYKEQAEKLQVELAAMTKERDRFQYKATALKEDFRDLKRRLERDGVVFMDNNFRLPSQVPEEASVEESTSGNSTIMAELMQRLEVAEEEAKLAGAEVEVARRALAARDEEVTSLKAAMAAAAQSQPTATAPAMNAEDLQKLLEQMNATSALGSQSSEQAKQMEARAVRAEATLRETQTRLAAAEGRVADAERTVGQTKEEVAEAKRSRDEAQAAADSLKAKLEGAQAMVDSLTAAGGDAAALAEELKKLGTEKEAVVVEKMGLERALEEAKEAQAMAEQRATDAEAAARDARSTVPAPEAAPLLVPPAGAEDSADVAAMRAEMEALQRRLDDASTAQETADQEVADLKEKLADAEAVKEELTAKVQELEEQAEQLNESVAGMAERIAELEASQEGLAAAMADKDDSIGALSSALEEEKAKVEELAGTLAKEREDGAAKQEDAAQKVAEAQKELADVTAEFDQVNIETLNMEERHETVLKERDDKITALEEELAATKKEKEEDAAKAEEEGMEWLMDKEALERRVEELEGLLEAEQKLKEKVDGLLNDEMKRSATLREEKEAANKRTAQMKETLDSIKIERLNLTKELRETKQELERQTNKLENLQQRNEGLKEAMKTQTNQAIMTTAVPQAEAAKGKPVSRSKAIFSVEDMEAEKANFKEHLDRMYQLEIEAKDKKIAQLRKNCEGWVAWKQKMIATGKLKP